MRQWDRVEFVVLLDRENLSNGAHSTKPLAHKVAAVASHFVSALR